MIGAGRAARRPGAATLPGTLLALLIAPACACVRGPALEEWTLAAREVRVLGADDAGPESAFYRPSDIALDGTGHLYVLDSGNNRIQVFGADGSFLRTVGRPGAGPGELKDPEALWVFGDGEIVVADTGNRRLQRFGPAGEPIATIPVDYVPIDLAGNDRFIFVLRLPPPPLLGVGDQEPLVRILDRDGVVLDGMVPPQQDKIGLFFFLRNALRIAPAPNGGFALADTHVRARIRVYAVTGELEREIPVLYKAQAWAPLGRVPSAATDESLRRVARTATDLCWDPRRRLYWVLAGTVDRRAGGEPVLAREVYRYDVAGNYQGSVMLAFRGLAMAAAPDGTLWVLDVDGAAHRLRIDDPEPAVPPRS